MKTILTFLIIVSAFFSYAQTDIESIDKKVKDIKSKISTFQKIEKVKTTNGYRFVYLKSKELQLITISQKEMGLEKNVEWYYANNILIYSETNWFDTSTKKNVRHEKQYLNKEHLIAWIDQKNQLIDIGSYEFKYADSVLVPYGVKMKNSALE